MTIFLALFQNFFSNLIGKDVARFVLAAVAAAELTVCLDLR